MSKYYYDYDSREAYNRGKGDERYSRRNYDYDRHSDREKDRAYFDGRKDADREERERRYQESQEEFEQEERRQRRLAEERMIERQQEEEELYYQQMQQSEPEPDFLTCEDCVHWAKCKSLIKTLTGKETNCDFVPSRFTPAPAGEEEK